MSLRRKLLTIFAGVGLLALLLAGMTVWSTITLQKLHHELEDHYRRSLLLQRVSFAVSVAYREHLSAMVTESPDAREKFDKLDRQVLADLEAWSAVASTREHADNLEAVATSYGKLRDDVKGALEELDAGRPEKALSWFYRFRARNGTAAFEEVTERLIAFDRSQREFIYARVDSTRSTIEILAVVAGVGALSLVFLLVAYLASDVFAPLRDLEKALGSVAGGDTDVRLDEERDDELGQVNRAFNRAVEAVSRQRLVGEESGSRNTADASPGRLLLPLAERVQAAIEGLGETQLDPALREDVHALTQTVLRVGGLGLPETLSLSTIDLRALLYEVLVGFQEELVRRGVSVELRVASGVEQAVIDHARVREALRELVRGALRALPSTGGRLGLRAAMGADGLVILEVADDGRGLDLSSWTEDGQGESRELLGAGLGLAIAREVAERHGGRLVVDAAPGEGTHVQVRLPLKPAA